MCRFFGWTWDEYLDTPEEVLVVALEEFGNAIHAALLPQSGCAFK